ncbi:MAG: redoxin domain-containing protein [Desulfobacterales bacterium]
MRKNIKIALICVLLIGSGFAVFFALDADPEARAKPAGRDVDLLFEKMGVVRIQPGTNAVNLRLPDINGQSVGLSDFRGKIVFLNFWATWCPTCAAEMPAMEKLHRGQRKKDFAVVTISLQDSAEQVKDSIILDKAGQAIGVVIGAREWDSRESMELFKHLADNDQPVSTVVAAEPG